MSVKGLVERAITTYIDSVTEEREPDGMIHPSSASMCARRVVYSARSDGTPEELDTKTKRKFYIGHRLHEIVQRAIEADLTIEHYYPEATFSHTERGIKGAADAVFQVDGKWYILEVKSISKGSLRYGGMPKEHHQTQAEIYALCAEEVGFDYTDHLVGGQVWHDVVTISGIKYVYLEKENLEVYEYDEKFTEARRARITEYVTRLQQYIEDGTALPARLQLTKAGKKPWPCNYCPFAEPCWKVDPAEIPLGSF